MIANSSEKKGTSESFTSRCKTSTEEQAKKNRVSERVRVGLKKDTKVAKVAKMQTR